MNLAQEVLNLLESFYRIEVDLRDAGKAQDALTDARIDYELNGSEVFLFQDQDDLFSALEILQQIKVVPASIEGDE